MSGSATQYKEASIEDLVRHVLGKDAEGWDVALTLRQNLDLLLQRGGQGVSQRIDDALREAYNHKYGDWDQVNDLQALYGADWCQAIRPYFAGVDAQTQIVDIGGNDGRELRDILQDRASVPSITIVDMSDVAVGHLRAQWPWGNMNVVNEALENADLAAGCYDFCISLRTIHASAIDLVKGLEECIRITRRGGRLIMSVSNGYIEADSRKPILGMYDARSGQMDPDRPYELARQISSVLASRGVRNLQILDLPSEIVVSGVREL